MIIGEYNMNETDFFLCVQFVFHDFLDKNWDQSFFNISEKLESEFDIKYKRFAFSYLQDEIKLKNLLLNSQNIKKYETIKKNNDIIHISVYSLLSSETPLHNAEFELSINKKYNKIYPNPKLYIHFELHKLNTVFNGNWRKLFTDLLNIANRFGKVKYGLLEPLQKEKGPSFYFLGLPMSTLPEEEKIRVWAWKKNMKNFDTLIRDVYFANFISAGHLHKNEHLLDKVSDLVGSENILSQKEGTIFYLPFELCDISKKPNEINEIRNNLRKYFATNNLLMINKGNDPYETL